MTSIDEVAEFARHSAPPPAVVVGTLDGAGVRTVRRRRSDRLRTRLRSFALDEQLAAGTPPEAGRLLAVRAADLVDPTARAGLARHWENVVARAAAPTSVVDPRAPLARGRVLAATSEIAQLCDALRRSAPVAARGVAWASLLLRSGASPIYRGRGELREPVSRAVELLALDALG